MKQFFEVFSGPTALLSSIVICILLARSWKGTRHARTRRHLVPLLYWGPTVLIAFMVMHCGHNAYITITNSMQAGKSVFNFYYYSLQLMGVVVAYESYLLLQCCHRHVAGTRRLNGRLFFHIALIIVTTLPTAYFTPPGAIPTIVLIITSIAALLVHKGAPKTAPVSGPEASESLLPAEMAVG
ncbi:MAG TPA: hypothetical protein VHK69_03090 [Chitinophagaceae bacterium]|jgi:hypothetical protein|nr:hypothetical protein [Chitinophagaceae bacterium]